MQQDRKRGSMKKIKLFSVKENKNVEGSNAELYCNLYLVFNRTYLFTFLIESPNFSCSDRNLIWLIKHWMILVEEDYVKYMRKYEATGRKRG